MLRAGTKGPDPLVIAGLTEENLNLLRDGHPIAAPLKDFSPNLEGSLFIFYGRTHADLEAMLIKSGSVTVNTAMSSCPRMEQHEAASRDFPRILICTVGLPRSGKTTWAKTQAYPIVNPDSIRLAIHGNRFIMQAEPYVWAIARTMVNALFLAGHSKVIVDATNNTKKRRDAWLDPNWKTFFKIIDTSAEECMKRAENDAEIRPVIERMQAEREPLEKDALVW